MIDLSKLSSQYNVRTLDENDVNSILEVCMRNTLFYEYTDAEPDIDQIKDDMKLAPPGIDPSDKYYFGFFNDRDLVAVMDLVDGYPEQETAYIGFFMMELKYQGKQIGTSIISEVLSYLRSIGKKAVRLGIDKGNPQSTHFWIKNGFEIIREVDVNGWIKLVAERSLV